MAAPEAHMLRSVAVTLCRDGRLRISRDAAQDWRIQVPGRFNVQCRGPAPEGQEELVWEGAVSSTQHDSEVHISGLKGMVRHFSLSAHRQVLQLVPADTDGDADGSGGNSGTVWTILVRSLQEVEGLPRATKGYKKRKAPGVLARRQRRAVARVPASAQHRPAEAGRNSDWSSGGSSSDGRSDYSSSSDELGSSSSDELSLGWDSDDELQSGSDLEEDDTEPSGGSSSSSASEAGDESTDGGSSSSSASEAGDESTDGGSSKSANAVSGSSSSSGGGSGSSSSGGSSDGGSSVSSDEASEGVTSDGWSLSSGASSADGEGSDAASDTDQGAPELEVDSTDDERVSEGGTSRADSGPGYALSEGMLEESSDDESGSMLSGPPATRKWQREQSSQLQVDSDNNSEGAVEALLALGGHIPAEVNQGYAREEEEDTTALLEDNPQYSTIPLSPGLWRQMQEMATHKIFYRDCPTTLGDRVNFPFITSQESSIARCVLEPGSWLMYAVEQGEKTAATAALCGVAAFVGKPAVVVVNDKSNNVASVKDKMQELVECVNLVLGSRSACKVVYCSGSKRHWKALSDGDGHERFKRGNLVPVVLCTEAALKQLAGLLRAADARDVVMIVDEADSIWANISEHKWTKRERGLYNIIGGANGTRPLTHTRIRSFIQMTATHITTAFWHTKHVWDLSYKVMSADLELLKQRGYTLPRDIKAVKPFLADEDVKGKEKAYGFHSPKVRRMLKVFGQMKQPSQAELQSDQAEQLETLSEAALIKAPLRRTPADPPMGKIGRLMQVSLNPLIEAAGPNNFTMAQEALDLVPDASAIVVSAKGIMCFRKGQRPKLMKAENGAGQRVLIRDVSQAIARLDRAYGLECPILVFGFGCLMRAASVRSKFRVPTHAIMNMSAGRTVADLEQMYMRPGGKTKELRHLNGFGRVRLLCRKADYMILRRLCKFTDMVLSVSGTGQLEDASAFLTHVYPRHLRHIIHGPKGGKARKLGRGSFDPPREGMRVAGGDAARREAAEDMLHYNFTGSLQPFAVAACGEVCEAGLSVEDYIRNKTGRDIYMHTGFMIEPAGTSDLFDSPAVRRYYGELCGEAGSSQGVDPKAVRKEIYAWGQARFGHEPWWQDGRAAKEAEKEKDRLKGKLRGGGNFTLVSVANTVAATGPYVDRFDHKLLSVMFVPGQGAVVVLRLRSGKPPVGSNAVRAFHILRAGETYEMVLRCTGASSSDAAAGGAAR